MIFDRDFLEQNIKSLELKEAQNNLEELQRKFDNVENKSKL